MNERNSGEWASAQRLRLAPSQSPLSRAGRPGRHPAALPPAGSAGGRPRSRAAGGAGSRPPAVPLRGAVEERAAFPPPEPRDAPHPTRSPRVSSGSGLRASSAAAHLLAGTSLAGHGGLKQGWGATAPQQIKTPFKSAPSRRRHCGQLLGRTNRHGPQLQQRYQQNGSAAPPARLSAVAGGGGGEEPRGACRERPGRGERARVAEVRHMERKCATAARDGRQRCLTEPWGVGGPDLRPGPRGCFPAP